MFKHKLRPGRGRRSKEGLRVVAVGEEKEVATRRQVWRGIWRCSHARTPAASVARKGKGAPDVRPRTE